MGRPLHPLAVAVDNQQLRVRFSRTPGTRVHRTDNFVSSKGMAFVRRLAVAAGKVRNRLDAVLSCSTMGQHTKWTANVQKSRDGFMRLNVDIVTSGGMQGMSKKRNVTEVCCKSQSKTRPKASIGNHDWSKHMSTVREIRLAEFVIDIVASGAHAVFEMF